MKKIILSLLSVFTLTVASAQGGIVDMQDFETLSTSWTTFNLGTLGSFTRNTPVLHSSEYVSVPAMTGSSYLMGFNDDAMGDTEDLSDVYVASPFYNWSTYDSVAVYFDYYNTEEDFENSYFYINVAGNHNSVAQGDVYFAGMPAVDVWTSQFMMIKPSVIGNNNMANISVGFNFYDDGYWLYGLFVDNIVIIGYKTSPNETCATAYNLTPQAECTAATSTQGNMSGSNGTAMSTGCSAGVARPDVWFSFEANNTTATVSASSLVVYDLDVAMEIYSGTCGNLTLMQCVNDDAIISNGTGEESVELTGLVVGNTYYVRLMSMLGATDLGGFSICVESEAPAIPCTLPTPVVTASATSVCSGATITLTASGTAAVQWYLNGTAISGATAATYTATTSGSYSVKLTDASCATVESNVVAVTVNAPITHTQALFICEGGSVTVGNSTYTDAGIYTDVLTAASGCDSTVTTVLEVGEAVTHAQTLSICAGGSITVGNSVYTTAGTYTDIFVSALGCDSTVTTTIVLGGAVTHAQTLSICFGGSVTVGNSTYSNEGTYTDLLTAASGCDSTVTTTIVVQAPITHAQTLTICSGGSVTVGNSTYTTAGTYNDVLNAASGCDSTVTTTIVVQAPITHAQTLTICSGGSVTVGNSTYTTAGTYNDVLTAASGCDSIVTTTIEVTDLDLDAIQTGASFAVTAVAGATFAWYDCATNAEVGTGASFTATANGSYKVTATAGSCTETSACFTVNGLSIDAALANAIVVAPNPASSFVTINAGDQTLIAVSILDCNGRLIQQATASGSVTNVDLNDLQVGVYFLAIETEVGSVTKKIVKQ